jgi:hypothetical protein
MTENPTNHKSQSNGNDPAIKVVSPPVKRARSSWPILVVAILFVVGALLTWYYTWFGRQLSDEDIATYLVDYQHPRKVQHALVQIQQRIEDGDKSAKKFYPQLVELTNNPETELRLTVAWLMGFDNQTPEFHSALTKLLSDNEPIVRRNAALALVRFGDPLGRDELRSVLAPYQLRAPVEGTLHSSLKSGSEVSRGALLARLQGSNQEIVDLRAPIPGKIGTIMVQSNAHVIQGEPLLTIFSDEASVWEALRGLALVGDENDLKGIRDYLQNTPVTDRIKEQAALTVKSIQSRNNK